MKKNRMEEHWELFRRIIPSAVASDAGLMRVMRLSFYNGALALRCSHQDIKREHKDVYTPEAEAEMLALDDEVSNSIVAQLPAGLVQ